jgi:hypothetical protein
MNRLLGVENEEVIKKILERRSKRKKERKKTEQ